jgi:hypothetical protein
VNGANDGPSLTLVAVEIRKPAYFYPVDLAVSPLNPVLMRRATWMSRIDRCLTLRQEPFRVIWMHQVFDVLDRHFVGANIENLLKARIPRNHAASWIVLPAPQLG